MKKRPDSSSKMPPRESSQAKTSRESHALDKPYSLLSPFHLKLAEFLNKGESLKTYKNVQVRLNVSPEIDAEITEHVVAWLKTQDAAHLAKVLEKYPKAISLDSIHQQIFHLSRLLRMVSEEEVHETEGYVVPGDALEWGLKPAARATLHQLLQAWVSGVLPG